MLPFVPPYGSAPRQKERALPLLTATFSASTPPAAAFVTLALRFFCLQPWPLPQQLPCRPRRCCASAGFSQQLHQLGRGNKAARRPAVEQALGWRRAGWRRAGGRGGGRAGRLAEGGTRCQCPPASAASPLPATPATSLQPAGQRPPSPGVSRTRVSRLAGSAGEREGMQALRRQNWVGLN